MKIPTTLDRKTWKKWLICPTLAVLLALTVLTVYDSDTFRGSPLIESRSFYEK